MLHIHSYLYLHLITIVTLTFYFIFMLFIVLSFYLFWLYQIRTTSDYIKLMIVCMHVCTHYLIPAHNSSQDDSSDGHSYVASLCRMWHYFALLWSVCLSHSVIENFVLCNKVRHISLWPITISDWSPLSALCFDIYLAYLMILCRILFKDEITCHNIRRQRSTIILSVKHFVT